MTSARATASPRFTFGSYDLLIRLPTASKKPCIGSEFYRLDLRHEHDFGACDHTAHVRDVRLRPNHPAERRNAQDRMVRAKTRILSARQGHSRAFRRGRHCR
jgi:hypothetical protein